MNKSLIYITFLLALTACSSVKSTQAPNAETTSDGLTYFMPKKDFLVKVTVANGKVSNIALDTTEAYPDLSIQYVLNHDLNIVGKNTLNVGVNEKGLLSSATSTTTSGVSEAFQGLAKTLGTIHTMAVPPGINNLPSPPAECKSDGIHTFIYNSVTGPMAVCNDIKITITHETTGVTNLVAAAKENATAYSGIFYRQSQPFRMRAEGSGFIVESTVYSPSYSHTLFLPVSKTFFSDNKADFAFKDGMPTKYDQQTDGEIVAALKLPADVIGAYFGAVGNLFNSFKSTDTAEISAVNEKLKLEMANRKLDACLAAIKSNDPNQQATLEALGCSSP